MPKVKSRNAQITNTSSDHKKEEQEDRKKHQKHVIISRRLWRDLENEEPRMRESGINHSFQMPTVSIYMIHISTRRGISPFTRPKSYCIYLRPYRAQDVVRTLAPILKAGLWHPLHTDLTSRYLSVNAWHDSMTWRTSVIPIIRIPSPLPPPPSAWYRQQGNTVTCYSMWRTPVSPFLLYVPNSILNEAKLFI